MLHATRRGFGDRHGQYHHGGCDGQGFHDHLQRRMRTLHPATVPDAQPHGRTHLGHRLEPAHHRGCPGAARHRTHAAARHDRGRQLHRSGSHDPFGADDPQRFVREPGHHPRPVRPSGHPLRTARRRHLHSPTGALPHRELHGRLDHDHRRRTLAGAHARPAVGIPRGGHPSTSPIFNNIPQFFCYCLIILSYFVKFSKKIYANNKLCVILLFVN